VTAPPTFLLADNTDAQAPSHGADRPDSDKRHLFAPKQRVRLARRIEKTSWAEWLGVHRGGSPSAAQMQQVAAGFRKASRPAGFLDLFRDNERHMGVDD
jgi:hypothetical protein